MEKNEVTVTVVDVKGGFWKRNWKKFAIGAGGVVCLAAGAFIALKHGNKTEGISEMVQNLGETATSAVETTVDTVSSVQ